MYRVNAKAEFDLEDILERLNTRTKAICVTHYFGRPADLRALAQICRDRDVKILEDCAHSMFDVGVGRSGHAAIFSLRKSLPASDGGVLAMRYVDGGNELGVVASSQIAARGTLSLLKRWVQRKFWIRGRNDSEREAPSDACESEYPEVPSSYYFAADAPITGASRLARGLLNRIDSSEIVVRRRENYHLLHGLVKGVRGFVPLWDEDLLAPGLCPLGLPGFVDEKNRWVSALNRAAVSVSPWWAGFFRGLDWNEFPEARKLKQRLLLLPVHQGLTAGDMKYIAAVARRIG
jgi:dTDP-4-amino-4,6-dideoxygalactose transaminase